MNAEEHIQNMKQIPPLSKFEKKRKMKTAIVLTMATLISLMFLVYAFMQKLEADKQRAIATVNMMEAQRQRAEAERQRLTAEYQQMEAVKQKERAEEALAECEKSKKK